MSILKQSLSFAVCGLLCVSTAAAGRFQHDGGQGPATSKSVAITIEQRKIRFAASAAAQEISLEIFNQTGELIYTSGVVSGHVLAWNLQNAGGEPGVPSECRACGPLTKIVCKNAIAFCDGAR